MKPRHSIRLQIIFALNLVAVAVALVLGWQGVRSSANVIEKLLVEDAAQSTSQLIRTMNLPLSPHLMEQLAKVLDCEVVAFAGDGEIIASSLEHLSARIVSNVQFQPRKSHVLIDSIRYRVAFAEADDTGAILAILLSESRIRSAQYQATLNIVWMTLLVIALVTVVAWALGRRIARPINRLENRFRCLADSTAQARSAAEAEAVISDWHRECKEQERTGAKPQSAEIEALQSSFDSLLQQVYTAYERLDRAARLAAGGQLSTAVAHELRNPLSGVKMIAQVLLKCEELSTRSRESISMILGDVARMEAYLNTLGGLNGVGHQEAVPKEMLDLSTLVKQAVKGVSELAASKAVRLEVDVPGHPVKVEGVAMDLRRLVENLARNAVEASALGAEVRVVLESRSRDVVLRVFDTGPGVAFEVKDTLFEPFVSTRQGGTGLGLFFCSRIVAMHGGELTYHQDKETTEFRVLL